MLQPLKQMNENISKIASCTNCRKLMLSQPFSLWPCCHSFCASCLQVKIVPNDEEKKTTKFQRSFKANPNIHTFFCRECEVEVPYDVFCDENMTKFCEM